MSDGPTTKPLKPWVPHKPEQRFSIVVDQLFSRTLMMPFYVCATADEEGRTDNQRARDRIRGVKPGKLDWDVVQGPLGLARKLELKIGDNKPTDNQLVTMRKLAECGAVPILAWDLRQVHAGMVREGFRFSDNVRFVIAELEQELAAANREAAGVKAGTIVRKKSRPKKRPPRFLMGKQRVNRARKAGIMI